LHLDKHKSLTSRPIKVEVVLVFESVVIIIYLLNYICLEIY
jgi:hypothetical protein